MVQSIERLPSELVDMIIADLSLEDFQDLRLASRPLCYSTFSTFAGRYFTRRRTTLGAPSLNRLLRASSNPRLACAARLLDVRLLNNDDYKVLQDIHRIGIYPPPRRFPKIRNIKHEDISAESELFKALQTDGGFSEVVGALSRALRKLPNLTAIRFRVSGSMLEGTKHYVFEGEPYSDFVNASFQALLNAVVQSNVKLEEFTLTKGTKIRATTRSVNLVHSAFKLSVPMMHGLQKAFSSLKRLCLSIRTNTENQDGTLDWKKDVSRFIGAAPNLEELHLCFQPRDWTPRCRAAVFHALAISVKLHNLKRLQLYGCAADESDLLTLVRNHSSSLRRLNMQDITLRSGTWISVFAAIRDLLYLDYLRCSNLREARTGRDIWWTVDGKTWSHKLVLDQSNDPAGGAVFEMLDFHIGCLNDFLPEQGPSVQLSTLS